MCVGEYIWLLDINEGMHKRMYYGRPHDYAVFIQLTIDTPSVVVHNNIRDDS